MRQLRHLILAAFILAFLRTGPAAGQPPAVPEAPAKVALVHCGMLLAVPGKPPVANSTVIIKDGKILEVRAGFVTSEEAAKAASVDPRSIERIDLRDRFVLPGLIDCHTHVTFEFTADERLRRVQESDADLAIRAVSAARRELEAGFTTIRDLGSAGEAGFAIRDGINRGEVPGPRILQAGHAITPTGGHADRTLGYRAGLWDVPGALEGSADGSDECRKAVRAQVKRGADVIKLTATGGVLSNTGAGLEQQMFEDELRSIVETAHMLKRKVAAHAHGGNGIKAAVRAGVDSIEHGTYLDDEAIALMKERGTYLVATIIAGKTVGQRAEQVGYYPRAVAEKARIVGPVIQGAFAKAYKAGVKIAFGTDAGVFPHGENAREFEYMVEAGMPAAEAIRAATVNAADLCGLSAEIGTIEPGKAADLIATAKSPIDDITELGRVLFVMRGGTVHVRK